MPVEQNESDSALMSCSGMSEHHVLSQLTVCVCVYNHLDPSLISCLMAQIAEHSLLSVILNLWVKNICVHNVGTQCVHVFGFARTHFRILRGHSDHQDRCANSDLLFTFSKAWGNHYSLLFVFCFFHAQVFSCLPLPCPSSIDCDHNNRKCVENDFPFLWSLISPVNWLDASDIISHF